MLGVDLARLGGVVNGVGGMTRRDVRVVPGRFGIAFGVVLGRFAMMARRVFMMVGGLLVMFVCVVRGRHIRILSAAGREPVRLRSGETKDRPSARMDLRPLRQAFMSCRRPNGKGAERRSARPFNL
jgi:hypothetical protein